MFVYFMQTEEYVKIGITSNLKSRWKQVQTGCPVHIFRVNFLSVRSRDEALEIETAIHSRLAKYNTFGEWFILRRSRWQSKIFSVIKSFGYSRSDIRLLDDKGTLPDKSKSLHLRFLSIQKITNNAQTKIHLLSQLKNDIEKIDIAGFKLYTKPELLTRCDIAIGNLIKEIKDTSFQQAGAVVPVLDSEHNAFITLRMCKCEADLNTVEQIKSKFPHLSDLADQKKQKILSKLEKVYINNPQLNTKDLQC